MGSVSAQAVSAIHGQHQPAALLGVTGGVGSMTELSTHKMIASWMFLQTTQYP